MGCRRGDRRAGLDSVPAATGVTRPAQRPDGGITLLPGFYTCPCKLSLFGNCIDVSFAL